MNVVCLFCDIRGTYVCICVVDITLAGIRFVTISNVGPGTSFVDGIQFISIPYSIQPAIHVALDTSGMT
jgi:hypothetical protein